MLICRCLSLSVFLFAFGVSSQADVIDFETGSLLLGIGQTGSLEGFNFTTGGQSGSFIAAPVLPANCSPSSCVSDGTQTLGAFNGANVTIEPIIPVLFALDSFDVAGTHSSGSVRNTTSMEVIGNLFGGGQVTETFAMDPSTFQTLTLDSSFVNLSSVEFDALLPRGLNSPEFQLDNVVYSPSTVPEPASLVLLATVLLAAAFATLGRSFRRARPRANNSRILKKQLKAA